MVAIAGELAAVTIPPPSSHEPIFRALFHRIDRNSRVSLQDVNKLQFNFRHVLQDAAKRILR